MTKMVHCVNCDITYAPVGERGKLYCKECGAKVHAVISESDFDNDTPVPGVLIEAPIEVPVEPTPAPVGELIVEEKIVS